MRKKVLIVTKGDWIEVYADDDVDVKIVASPQVASPEGELLAEEYLDGILHPIYRELYCPGNLRIQSTIKPVRPSDIVLRNWELDMLRSVDRAFQPSGLVEE